MFLRSKVKSHGFQRLAGNLQCIQLKKKINNLPQDTSLDCDTTGWLCTEPDCRITWLLSRTGHNCDQMILKLFRNIKNGAGRGVN